MYRLYPVTVKTAIFFSFLVILLEKVFILIVCNQGLTVDIVMIVNNTAFFKAQVHCNFMLFLNSTLALIVLRTVPGKDVMEGVGGNKRTKTTLNDRLQGSQKLWKSWKITKKVSCMEKSWKMKKNLNNNHGKNHGIL